jgi:hypothetical protein
MKYKLSTLIGIFFAFSTLLQSCQSRSSALKQESSEPAASTKTNPSSIPVKIDSSPCYITFDNAKGVEKFADIIIVGKSQASIEDSTP